MIPRVRAEFLPSISSAVPVWVQRSTRTAILLLASLGVGAFAGLQPRLLMGRCPRGSLWDQQTLLVFQQPPVGFQSDPHALHGRCMPLGRNP